MAGLINDTVVGLPLGLSSLSYMLICIATSYFRNITIRPNQTNAENTESAALTTFDSDGYTLGSYEGINESGRPYTNSGNTSLAARRDRIARLTASLTDDIGKQGTKKMIQQAAKKEFELQEDEVDEILEIPLNSLLATQQKNMSFHLENNMITYRFNHHKIWGASAKILEKIEQLNVP